MLSKYRILKGDLRERGVCFLLPSDEAKTLSEIVSDVVIKSKGKA